MRPFAILAITLTVILPAFAQDVPTLEPTHDVAVHPGFIWANAFEDGEVHLAAEIFNSGKHREFVQVRFFEVFHDKENLLGKRSVHVPNGDMRLVTIPWEGEFKRHRIKVAIEIQERVMERAKENNAAMRWVKQVPGKGFIHERPETEDWSLPFVFDVYTPGTWMPLCKVDRIEDFNPYQRQDMTGTIGSLNFCIRGEMDLHIDWRWIKGYLITAKPTMARRYCIKEIRNMHYLFLEWSDPEEDSNALPSYQVFVRATPPLQEPLPGLDFTPEPTPFLYSGTT